jgi:hypothetical protein
VRDAQGADFRVTRFSTASDRGKEYGREHHGASSQLNVAHDKPSGTWRRALRKRRAGSYSLRRTHSQIKASAVSAAHRGTVSRR